MAFQRLVKKFWLANLLQAAAWAFMHSNYPQEPPYARGLELTVVGVIYGMVMNKFGLVACVLSHNLVDTFLGLTPLFASKDIVLKTSAYIAIAPLIGVVLLPILMRLFSKRFAPEEDLTNQALTPEKPHSIADDVQHTAHSYSYKQLSNGKRMILVVILIAAAATEFGLRMPTLAHQVQVTFSREDAIKAARKVLIERDLRPDNFSEVAWIASAIDLEEFQYVFEKAKGRMNSLASNPETPLLWTVRFYKPLSGDEYRVTFNASGKLQAVDVSLEEDEPGANLSKEEALAKVKDYFNKLHPEMLPFVVNDSRQIKRDKRTDWTFTFKLPQFKVAEADYRVTINCIGDQPSGFANGWLIPDKWKFHRSVVSTKETVLKWSLYLLEMALILLVVLWSRGVVRAAAIPWRPAIFVGLGTAALVIVRNLNDWPLFFSSYDPEAPLDTFFIQKTVSYILLAISSFSSSTVIAAFGLGSLRLLIPPNASAAILRTTITPTRGREMTTNRHLWLDAALIGLAIGTAWQALSVLTGFARFTFSPDLAAAPMETTCYLVNFLDPAIAMLLDSVHEGFQFPFAVAIVMGLYAKYVRRFRSYFILAVLFSLIYPCTDKYIQNYFIDASWYFISCMLLYLLIAKFARENFAAYFLTAACGSLIAYLRVIVGHGQAQYQQDIITSTVTVLLPLIYVLYASLNTATREAEQPMSPDAVHSAIDDPLPSLLDAAPSEGGDIDSQGNADKSH